jgi:hypothetical protein
MVAQVKAAPQASKVWLRKHRSPPFIYHNCYFLICLFDYLEEFKSLSPGERCLKGQCSNRLQLFLSQKAAYWKQRGKMKSLKEGDADTKFFHARASCRQRSNRIAAITVDGTVLVNHAAKSEAMTNYYTSILGVADDTRWIFDVATLYPVTHAAALADLVAPFSEGEALNAVKSNEHQQRPWTRWVWPCLVLPPSQIISHSKILGESKYLNLDQCYRKKYKDL